MHIRNALQQPFSLARADRSGSVMRSGLRRTEVVRDRATQRDLAADLISSGHGRSLGSERNLAEAPEGYFTFQACGLSATLTGGAVLRTESAPEHSGTVGPKSE